MQGFDTISWKRFLSFVIGAIIIVIGAIPLLNYAGVAFLASLPGFILSETTVRAALLIAGLLIFYDSFFIYDFNGRVKLSHLFMGLLLAVISAIPIAIQFKLVSFLPVIASLTIPAQLLQGFLIAYGAYLIYDAFLLRTYY